MVKLKGNIYYGIGPAPKSFRNATMIEAAKTHNVKRYGQYKIDSRLLDEYMSKKKESLAKQRTNIISEIGKYRGRIRKWELAKQAAQSLVNKKETKKITEEAIREIESATSELNKWIKELQQIEKQRGE
jgi:ATP-dependent protease HslVU (ClpYQ) ATPase subunit